MSGLQRAFADDLIKTYFDMGAAALERGEFAIAQKMFKAVFEEPSAKTQKEKIMLSLLIKSAQAHEGLRQFYKAKLLYIRALALFRKQNPKANMETVEILLVLARINAAQGLYRQSLEFAREAQAVYNKCTDKDSITFVRLLRQSENIMSIKARSAEQAHLLQIIDAAKAEALTKITSATFTANTGQLHTAPLSFSSMGR